MKKDRINMMIHEGHSPYKIARAINCSEFYVRYLALKIKIEKLEKEIAELRAEKSAAE